MKTRSECTILRRCAPYHLFLVVALSLGHVVSAVAQESPAAVAQETTVTADSLPSVGQKSDTSSTAPAFVPQELQGVGGRWIVPEESRGEMAVRPAESKVTESAKEADKLPDKVSEAGKPVESVSPTPAPEMSKKKSAKPPSDESVAPLRKQETEEANELVEQQVEKTVEKAEKEQVPPRPKWVTVSGKVESVKPLPKNELEVTVKSRDLGRVKVVVSPLQVQRVPGKGRQIRLRGVVIREGTGGLTIRAMEMDPEDEGAYVPQAVPMNLSVGFVYRRR
ncbi:MAG: hypothetical protein N2Z21_02340 [Candidatus Sumerlaeaceae bacterium]|nr:hypothetical protein [Candidatus Sumerlaeaceae bacterium]